MHTLWAAATQGMTPLLAIPGLSALAVMRHTAHAAYRAHAVQPNGCSHPPHTRHDDQLEQGISDPSPSPPLPAKVRVYTFVTACSSSGGASHWRGAPNRLVEAAPSFHGRWT